MSSIPALSFRAERGDVVVDLDRLISSRLLVQADSGGGKSRLLRAMCEQLHGRVQIIVLDPEGEFATLRERYPFLLAGRDGDVATDPKTAKLLARRLMELGASAVVDLYDLKLAERRRFVRIFLDEIMGLPRRLWRPCLFVLDEAHVYVPQGAESESSDAVITLCTQGRKRGYCAVLATQRISKLHKDAAAELKNRLIGSTGLDLDMKRAGDDLGFDKEQRLALRQLEPGSFWAFGPAITREPVLVRSGPVQTTHPTPGAVAAPTPPAPEAVRKMLSQMQGLEREAEEEARSIEDLQRQLTAAKAQVRKLERGAPAAVPDEKAIARAVATTERDLRKQFEEAQREQRTVERQLRAQIADQVKRGERIGKLLAQVAELAGAPVPEIAAAPTPQIQSENRPTPPVDRPKRERTTSTRASSEGHSTVTRPQLRILEQLAMLQTIGFDAPDRSTVAVFADQSPRSSGYANNLGALRSAGLIDYPAGGCVAITDDGLLLVDEIPEIATLDQLQEAWISRVSNPQRRILEELIRVYPDSIDRNALADLASQSSTSSGYANNLGFLRNSLGLIDYPAGGMVVATDRLFPEGLS